MFSASFFRLRRGGLDCSHDGLRLAGEMPLKKGKSAGGRPIWEPVTLPEFESALLSAYGVAEGAAQRIGGLRAVAAALNAGDIVLAQIAAVHLRLPDPLDLREASELLA